MDGWIRWLDSLLKDSKDPKGDGMEIRVERLGPNFRKQEEPACRSCGYDAEWICKIESLTGMFCERCFIDAWLDVLNFTARVPDAF